MKVEAKSAHDFVAHPQLVRRTARAAQTPADTDRAVGALTSEPETAITKEVRKAIVEIMKPGEDRPACPLGDKAAERRVHEAYTDDMRREFGPPPSGRTARRLFTRFLEGEAVPVREYRRQVDRKSQSYLDGRSAFGNAPIEPAYHAWLPEVGGCLLVDGSRIVAQPVEEGSPFYRLDDGGGERDGFSQGRAIAARVELRRRIEEVVAETPTHPSEGAARRPLPPIAPSPDMGDRVRIGGRSGECIGRTMSGRIAVALDERSASTGRRRVRTYPARRVRLETAIH